MQTDIPLSVITPVFNTLEYLETCIDSLRQQTLDNIELIFVDNGSTDGCYEKLKALESQYQSDLFRVVQVIGGRQGRCRNEGMKVARGEYIGFCDSDDWCAEDMFERLRSAAKRHDADIAIGQMIKADHQLKPLASHFGESYVKRGLYTEAEKPYLTRMTTCPNKIYRRTLLLENQVEFLEIAPHQDVTFAFKALYLARTVVGEPSAQYLWRTNPVSTTQSAQKKSAKPNEAIFEMSRELRRECDALQVSHDWVLAADRLIERHISLMVKTVPPSEIRNYLGKLWEAAGFLPESAFKKLQAPASIEMLGDKLYDYYQTQKRFAPDAGKKLDKYRKLSKKLGIACTLLVITTLALAVLLINT